MKKAVWVTITGVQINDLGEEDKIELMTHGKLFVKDKSFYIVYSESEISGMAGTTTSVKIQEDRVVLNRMGTSEQRQTFEVGVVNESNYITPFGSMWMRVLPSKVDVAIDSNGGKVSLEYELHIGRDKVSDNKLSIMIEEV